ncbi:MAG: twin-arginine translocation signal domain-containing protein [Thermoflexaceae bacterium]|nr:twin-arginine translocation signal domain-containing protein [Thermoflexaceae bacterium]
MTGRETAPRGLSRRHFLGLAGAGGAALFAAACGGSKSGDGGLASLPSPSASRTPTRPSASPAPTRPGASGQHGEAMRVTGYVTRDSSLDPHKTQAGPFYGIQSLVFSRLIAYQNQVDGAIVADLARDLPEQPDATTFFFRLNGGAKWQERPPVNGRAVTPADVKASILRQKDGDRSFVRKARWSVVESVDTPDPQTIVVKLAAPMAAALGLFADVNAFVIPEELAAGAFTLDTQVGSGPFRWVEWQDGKFASVSRNPGWHGGNARPYLDGLTVVQPKDTDELEAGLRTKKLDAVFVGRPQAEKLKRAVPQLQETTVGHSMFYGMRFFEPQFPYNDVRFRNAVAAALDRRAMIQQWFAGSGDLNPWVSWPMTRWTLPQSELTNVAGYRPGAAGREQDIAEARALMAAFRSEKKLPTPTSPLRPRRRGGEPGAGQPHPTAAQGRAGPQRRDLPASHRRPRGAHAQRQRALGGGPRQRLDRPRRLALPVLPQLGNEEQLRPQEHGARRPHRCAAQGARRREAPRYWPRRATPAAGAQPRRQLRQRTGGGSRLALRPRVPARCFRRLPAPLRRRLDRPQRSVVPGALIHPSRSTATGRRHPQYSRGTKNGRSRARYVGGRR